MPVRWKKLLRRSTIALVAVVIGLLLLAVVVGQWLAPLLIEREIKKSLAEHWDGRISMRGVSFSYFGPIDISGLRLEDHQGRPWVEIGNLRAHLRDWPGLSPVIHELELDEVRAQVYVAANLPLIQPETEGDPSEFIALDRITVHELSVWLHHAEETLSLGTLRARVDIVDNNYDFDIAPKAGEEASGQLRTNGRIFGDTGEIAARLRVDRQVSRQDMDFLQSFVEGDLPVRQAEGWLTAQADVQGPMKHREMLDIVGEAALESWSARFGDDVLVRDMDARLTFSDWRFEAQRVRMVALDSVVTAGGWVDLKGQAPLYKAWARSDDIDLGRVGEILDLAALSGGWAGAEVSLAGPAEGQVLIEGSAEVRAELDAGPVRAAGGPMSFAAQLPLGEDLDAAAINGHLDLQDWQVFDEQGALVRRLRTRIVLQDDHVIVDKATAEALGGLLTVSGRIGLKQARGQEPPRFQGRLLATDLSVERIAPLVGLDDSDLTGVADFDAQWTISRGQTWLAEGVGGASMVVVASGDRHLINGDFSVQSEPMAEEMQMVVALHDWDWLRNNVRLAVLPEARAEVREKAISIEHLAVLTAGGRVEGQADLQRLDDGSWGYEGQLSSRNFDPLAFLPPAGGDMPLLLVTMDGAFRGRGGSWLEASADGIVAAIWPEQYAVEAASDVAIDFALQDMQESDLLERMRLIVDLDAGQVIHRGRPVFTDIAARAQVRANSIESTFRGHGAGGRFEGQVVAAEEDGLRSFSGEAKLEEIDLARLPMLTGPTPWLAGTDINSRVWMETGKEGTMILRGSGSAVGTFNLEELSHSSGDYEFDLEVKGLDEEAGPEVHGTARLANGLVSNPRGVLVDNLRMSAISFGRSVDVSSIRGTILGGRSHGLFRYDFPADEPMSFRGGINISRLSLNRAATAFGHTGEKVAGNADFGYRFSGRSFEPEEISGDGVLLVRDSEMGGVPLFQAILGALQASEAARDTDVDLKFENQGPLVTVVSGRIGTPAVAIRPLPGGTINVETGELDVTVVAAFLSDLEELVNIPVLELLVPLVARLTQVEVTGNWESRETIQTRVRPVTGVGEATAEFFKGAASTGGDLGEALLQPLR